MNEDGERKRRLEEMRKEEYSIIMYKIEYV
jgi:hypothetical protein